MAETDSDYGRKGTLERLGKGMVFQLFVLLKTAQNYPEGHVAINVPAEKLLNSVREISRLNEEATVRCRHGYLALGEVRLKGEAIGIDAFTFTMGEMRRYHIGSMHFYPEVTAGELARFAYLLREVEPLPTPQTFERLLELLPRRSVVSIELEMPAEDEWGERQDDVLSKDAKEKAKHIYFQTMTAVAEVMESAKMGQTLRLRKPKRAIQGMVDQLLLTETNLLGLTTLRCHDEYTYNHSVNVCILSLVIGQRVGLPKDKLCDLGMAAVFHDIGKADIPLEVLNKPADFTREEWELMQKHPLLGVKMLMQLKGLDALSARIITGAFEHHLNYDLSGYPNIPDYKRQTLFGRIIAIADCYDGFTSSRVYSRVPYPPDRALKLMLLRAGKAYDPLLMKLFVNSIGVYPIGTLLMLNTRELAVVIENNPDPSKWNLPRVKIIADSGGHEIDGEILDLALPMAGRSISETLDPNRHRFDISRYFT